MTTPATLSMAKRMINASICAYQIHEDGWVPGPGTHPKVDRPIQVLGGNYFYNVVPEYQDAVGFIGPSSTYAPDFVATGDDDINAGLVGVMKDGNLVISLRGTLPPNFKHDDLVEWILDWAQDAEIPPYPWQMAKAPFTDVCKVEKGFAEATLNLWPSLAGFVDSALANHPSITGIVVTGHSKGAAMTFLVASLVALHYPQFKGKIQVFAFAAPATGDNNFCAAYNGMGLGASTHRYQVQNDLVPFMPLWIDADVFKHVKADGWIREWAWKYLESKVRKYTDGGYNAVGDFTYFDSSHNICPGAVVDTSALVDVSATLQAAIDGKTSDFVVIADAHSAVNSYRPCFNPY